MATSASATVSSDSVVSTTARSARTGGLDDQGEREGVAWTSGNLGDALWAVDHDDGVVGALEEAVDADLAHVAAESVDQAGGQVGAKRSDKLGGVAQEA
jgi:hypothetical protein